MYRRRWYIGICIIAITLLYIWNNSLQSPIVSNGQSERVLDVIEDVFRTPPLDTEEAQHIVRKVAHVLEFALLGLEIALLLYLIGKMRRQNLVAVLFIGLVSAVMDETIQIFSQRGSLVMDIWIDFAGFTAGVGLGLFLIILLRRAILLVSIRKQTTTTDKKLCPNSSSNDAS